MSYLSINLQAKARSSSNQTRKLYPLGAKSGSRPRSSAIFSNKLLRLGGFIVMQTEWWKCVWNSACIWNKIVYLKICFITLATPCYRQSKTPTQTMSKPLPASAPALWCAGSITKKWCKILDESNKKKELQRVGGGGGQWRLNGVGGWGGDWFSS